jgi:glucitol operon activator protein
LILGRFGFLFLVVALAWILQLALSLLQTRRFHRRITELRRGSFATATGFAGSNWKRKVYGVLVVNENYEVIHAEKLTGFTVFASLKPVPDLVGLSVDRLEQDEPVAGIAKKTWLAFQNAAKYLLSHKEEDDEDESED